MRRLEDPPSSTPQSKENIPAPVGQESEGRSFIEALITAAEEGYRLTDPAYAKARRDNEIREAMALQEEAREKLHTELLRYKKIVDDLLGLYNQNVLQRFFETDGVIGPVDSLPHEIDIALRWNGKVTSVPGTSYDSIAQHTIEIKIITFDKGAGPVWMVAVFTGNSRNAKAQLEFTKGDTEALESFLQQQLVKIAEGQVDTHSLPVQIRRR
jgi:hypothetical protein